MNESLKEESKKISEKTIETYYKEFNDFLRKNQEEYYDVVIMLMDIINSISTCIYYSIKQLNPVYPVNFDFIKAKIINKLSDSFEEIKKFNP